MTASRDRQGPRRRGDRAGERVEYDDRERNDSVIGLRLRSVHQAVLAASRIRSMNAAIGPMTFRAVGESGAWGCG
jgi:hypothetical protein